MPLEVSSAIITATGNAGASSPAAPGVEAALFGALLDQTMGQGASPAIGAATKTVKSGNAPVALADRAPVATALAASATASASKPTPAAVSSEQNGASIGRASVEDAAVESASAGSASAGSMDGTETATPGKKSEKHTAASDNAPAALLDTSAGLANTAAAPQLAPSLQPVAPGPSVPLAATPPAPPANPPPRAISMSESHATDTVSSSSGELPSLKQPQTEAGTNEDAAVSASNAPQQPASLASAPAPVRASPVAVAAVETAVVAAGELPTGQPQNGAQTRRAASPTVPARPAASAASVGAATASTSAPTAHSTALPPSSATPTPPKTDTAPVLQNPAAPADNQATAQPGNNTGNSRQTVGTAAKAEERHGDAVTAVASPKAPSADSGAAAASVPPIVAASPASASAAVAPALSTADQAQAARQVSDSMQTLATQSAVNGQRQVTVNLHPKEWGQVTVSVTMTPTTQADGKTTTQIVAHVVADQPVVKAALETHQADLRQALKETGFSLDRLTITVRPATAAAQSGLGSSQSDNRGSERGSFSGTSPGNGAQSGASAGGNSSSSFAAYSQGGQGSQGRHSAPPAYASAGQPAETEPPLDASPLRRTAGLVDTMA